MALGSLLAMAALRDYKQWLHRYNDPGSALSWRLRTVQEWLRTIWTRALGRST